MPQSQLPDLNTKWLKWTDYVNTCLVQKEYMGAISGVYHINAIFGDENRVEINSEKYNRLTKEQQKVKCPSCDEEINWENVRFFDLLNPLLAQVITGCKTDRVWDCPKCGNTNKANDTELIKSVFENPRYISIIPEPPIQKIGITGRRNFERESRDWIRLALDEISFSLGLERREYVPMLDRADVIENEDNN